MYSWNTKVKISAVLCALGSIGAFYFLHKGSLTRPFNSSNRQTAMQDTGSKERPRIYLRHDQDSQLYKNVSKPGVAIFAPYWLQEALERLEPKLVDVSFEVRNERGKVLDVFTLKKPISLTDLQKITRNEPVNTSGNIQLENYLPSVDIKLILTLKDLVRQCVTVGVDRTVAYGGYYSTNVPQSSKVYLCDLIGLQFQRPENTGRLVLVAPEEAPFPKGPLDDFIFQHVVGENKSSFKEAKKDSSGRYVPFSYRRHGTIFFDTYAYKKFVASDVVLCGIALETLASQLHIPSSEQRDSRGASTTEPPSPTLPTEEQTESMSGSSETNVAEQHTETTATSDETEALEIEEAKEAVETSADKHSSKPTIIEVKRMDSTSGGESEAIQLERKQQASDTGSVSSASNNDGEIRRDRLNLKFLKYGTGFFAAQFREVTESNILPAVIDGLEELFRVHHPKHIKAVEFPFYKPAKEDLIRLETFQAKYGVHYRISNDDALKDTVEGLVTATTNCADPHATTGNEMGFSSVDAAIATNLESKGNIFCPLLNPDIQSYFVSIHKKSLL